MLTIREEQKSVFDQVAERDFRQRMLAHSREFTPILCEVLGEAQLETCVSSAIDRARQYGFNLVGSIRLFVELMFLRGSGFDNDPQYPEFGRRLKQRGDERTRVNLMRDFEIHYQSAVSGLNGTNTRAALERLAQIASAELKLNEKTIDRDILEIMHRCHPGKARFVGEGAMQMLILKAKQEAAAAGFPAARGTALLSALMFAFGHACTADPLYPWISSTISDDRIVDGAARAERLERKSVTWLNRVLERMGRA